MGGHREHQAPDQAGRLCRAPDRRARRLPGGAGRAGLRCRLEPTRHRVRGLVMEFEILKRGHVPAVYTVKLQGVVFALHAFQKKSRKGRETPQQEIELVRRRLKRAEEIHAAMVKARGASHEEED
ncbi:MAG: type II toxin-antitoxin system RelE/ParE family toxin [Deltaproteobacteria bacterium]